MPTAETKLDGATAEQQSAYDRYSRAVADHHVICAQRGSSGAARLEAALNITRTWQEFMEVSGVDGAGGRSMEDVRRIKHLQDELGRLTEATRSAYSMIHAANGMGVIENRPADIDQWDHDVCVCLFTDAQTVLRRALERADEL